MGRRYNYLSEIPPIVKRWLPKLNTEKFNGYKAYDKGPLFPKEKELKPDNNLNFPDTTIKEVTVYPDKAIPPDNYATKSDLDYFNDADYKLKNNYNTRFNTLDSTYYGHAKNNLIKLFPQFKEEIERPGGVVNRYGRWVINPYRDVYNDIDVREIFDNLDVSLLKSAVTNADAKLSDRAKILQRVNPKVTGANRFERFKVTNELDPIKYEVLARLNKDRKGQDLTIEDVLGPVLPNIVTVDEPFTDYWGFYSSDKDNKKYDFIQLYDPSWYEAYGDDVFANTLLHEARHRIDRRYWDIMQYKQPAKFLKQVFKGVPDQEITTSYTELRHAILTYMAKLKGLDYNTDIGPSLEMQNKLIDEIDDEQLFSILRSINGYLTDYYNNDTQHVKDNINNIRYILKNYADNSINKPKKSLKNPIFNQDLYYA